ncbi:translation elongation factor Ts [Iodidimonas sp. SYSU 1G8]|uniref:translation elongation factor Ts n=1 Tax=Iodidimonas sp. SYSU 1G8 TaxID=3133967 RepID=UPI0031FE55E4
MAEITAALVKELREKTGAGMMDCKKALTENSGDLEASIDWLRQKGLAAAAKKSGRVAAEGLVGISVGGKAGAVAEVNSETDFVARNETFQSFVKTVADLALANNGDQDVVLASGYPNETRTVAEQLTHLVATIGENMAIRRMASLSVSQGVVSSYVHNPVIPGLGKIGVIVALESAGDTAKLDAFGKQLAMHIAAAAPQSLSTDDLDQELVARERQVLVQQARESGRAEDIIQKMVDGRMRKFYEEVVLLSQTFVIDGESKIEKVVADLAKSLGTEVKVTGFVRFVLGEGIEKEEGDFAAEVASLAG